MVKTTFMQLSKIEISLIYSSGKAIIIGVIKHVIIRKLKANKEREYYTVIISSNIILNLESG